MTIFGIVLITLVIFVILFLSLSYYSHQEKVKPQHQESFDQFDAEIKMLKLRCINF